MVRTIQLLVVTVIVAAPFLTASHAAAQSSSGGSAPVTLELTLDEAVRRAVEHNPDLAVVSLDSAATAARIGESRGAFAPLFSTSLGRSSTVTPPTNSLSGDTGLQVNDWFSTTGVRQRLPWNGAVWSLSWEAARTTSNSPINAFDPSLVSGFEVAFSLPLLKDRVIDPARHQYIIARRSYEISELQYRETVVQTVAAVKAAYWTLKATRANVTVQERSLALAKDLARENSICVNAGQTPPLDLVQAEAEVAQRRENLIRARTEADDAEDALRTLIMDPADAGFWQLRLDPVEQPSAPGPLPDINAVVTEALGARSDLRRLAHERDNAQTDLDLMRNQRLPDVRFETSYRGSGLGGTEYLRTGAFPGVVTGERRRSFTDALGQIFTPDYPTWSVGVTVSYPVGNSYDEARFARAQFERRQADYRLASLRLEAAESIRRAARQVRSSAERVEAARASERLAQERLDSESRRYGVGLSTTFLVTQAQRDLLQAQVNLLQTTLDYESSLVSFEALRQAPALAASDTLGVNGASIIRLPTPAPRGLFRNGAAAGVP